MKYEAAVIAERVTVSVPMAWDDPEVVYVTDGTEVDVSFNLEWELVAC
jgi:hypothetical protein